MNADDLRAHLIRNWNDVALEFEERAPLYASRGGNLTARDGRQLGARVDVIEPGKAGCPFHFHWAQEELFLILEGEGLLRVADQKLPIRAGDVVSIPVGPDTPHQFLNTGTLPLKLISISTQQRPEVCEYPDSGKVGAFPGPPERGLLQRRANTLDYWDGEP
jgi:uncharacterized cupin superfamily protein